MIEYRKAGYSDIEFLTQMRISMLCDGSNFSEEFKDLIQRNTTEFISSGFQDNSFIAWIAVKDSRIIAMSGINFFTLPPNDWCPEGKTAYIGNMYTLSDYRKRGIAAHLLSLVIEEAKSRNCERILLNATDMGRPLYELQGFETAPTAMAFYPFKAD